MKPVLIRGASTLISQAPGTLPPDLAMFLVNVQTLFNEIDTHDKLENTWTDSRKLTSCDGGISRWIPKGIFRQQFGRFSCSVPT